MHPGIREMVRETTLRAEDLVLPLFFDERISTPRVVASMPGVEVWPVEMAAQRAKEVEASGVRAVILFGIPEGKDEKGSGAWASDGVVQRAIRSIKAATGLVVIADLCLCEYTSHGHCGLVEDGEVLNDETLILYGRTAVSQVEAGADMVAPSGMMDGMVRAIRMALDDAGHEGVPIMSYSAKYASAFYGPFRECADSCPTSGDRRSHQLDPANAREAVRELEMDAAEGADILMVKPAMPYLDVVRDARQLTDLPIAAYQVSGEYAMLSAAMANGWLGEEAVLESLLSIKRAGADIIITYFAEKVAKGLR
jgi:porphobilinogen synthase